MKYMLPFLAIVFLSAILPTSTAHAAGAPSPQTPMLDDNGGPTATINFDQLRLRRGPSFNASSLGALSVGTQVAVLGKSENQYWIKVSSPLGVGWVARPYIRMTVSLNRLPVVYVDSPFADVVASPSGNVRQGPSTDYPVVSQLPTGAEVDVVGKQPRPRWYKVTHPDGTVGWMRVDTVDVQGQDRQIPVTTAAPLAQINTYRLNVRTAPSLQAAIIGQVGIGQLFPIITVDARGHWYQIQGMFGTGWVSASYVNVIGSLDSVVQSGPALLQ